MTNNTINGIIESLKELSPQELETTTKAIMHLGWYDGLYENATNYILSTYPDMDIDKIVKVAEDIDIKLSYLGYGYRLVVYNKLNEPFIEDFIKTNMPKDTVEMLLYPIKAINTMILALHPSANIRDINNAVKDVKSMVDSLDLTYGEKWLIYNSLTHTYLKDLIETLEK